MKTIPINEATAPQLVAFAQQVLNLEGVSTSLAKAAIIAKMRAAAYDGDTIEVEDAAPQKPADAAPSGKPARKMVKVVISSSDLPGGKDPVFVSVNGVGMLVPRDEESEIPEEYEEALRNAKRYVYTALADGGLSEPREVPSYPYSRVA